MKLAVFVIVLVSGALSRPQDDPDEFRKPFVDPVEPIPPEQLPRIVNGRIADPHSIPYQVFLRVSQYGITSSCSGTLISQNYILTAAHCLTDGVKAEIYIGFYDLGKMVSGQKLVISTEMKSHEKYSNTDGIVYDIGVIRLAQPVVPNEYISIVNLPTRADIYEDYEGQNGKISGWGRTSGSDTISNVLMEANATVISNSLCSKYFKNLQQYNLCTSGALGVASCKGDSGGPLMIGNTQVGLVSFGVSNCLDGYPSAFTRISAFFDWIEDNTDVRFD